MEYYKVYIYYKLKNGKEYESEEIYEKYDEAVEVKSALGKVLEQFWVDEIVEEFRIEVIKVE